MAFDTEFKFVLPRGYIDENNMVHREGVMRLAKAYDEIQPLKDHRVQQNSAYLVVILLSRVIVSLGSLTQPIRPDVIENLFASDLSYLQEFYNQINGTGKSSIETTCPNCGAKLEIAMERSGG